MPVTPEPVEPSGAGRPLGCRPCGTLGSVSDPPDSPPAFGPRGYLPPRAAKRARKIVLREQMGIGWPLAAVAAAVVVALVGVTYLVRSGPPGAPFRAAGPLAEVAAGTAGVVAVDGGGELLVVRAGGRVRTFAPPDTPVRWCADSARLESAGALVWTLDGILVGGDGTGLRALPSTVYDGTVYADLTTPGRTLPAEPRGERPACT